MNGRFLLDTNIIIALFAAETSALNNATEASEVFVPSIAIGELYYGAQKSRHKEQNLARLDHFSANSAILGCDRETARWYGEIKNQLKIAGHPIPENDIWIAAIARQHQLTMVTRDSHFEQVNDLRLVNW